MYIRQCDRPILMDTKAVNAALELEKYDSAFKAMPKFVYMTLLSSWSPGIIEHGRYYL